MQALTVIGEVVRVTLVFPNCRKTPCSGATSARGSGPRLGKLEGVAGVEVLGTEDLPLRVLAADDPAPR